MDKYADLHLHTTASDGEYSPAFVVRAAKTHGFTAISITDHDTLGGLQEAMKEGTEFQLEVIPGVEISALWEHKEVHILGYYVNPDNENLLQKLEEMRNSRQERIRKMVFRLNELDYKIEMDKVFKISGQGAIGRPHIAKVLLEKGYVKTIKEAFVKLLSPGCPAYIPRYKITPQEAIRLILNAGGIPVLAHPGVNPDDAIIPFLKKEGLQGIEVWHPEHSTSIIEKYIRMAKEFDLLMTGGSDWHGGNKDSGFSLGNIKIDYCYVRKLKEIKGVD
ncbi:MAG: PHP domain-containing protein [Bacillota bacterium]